MRAKLFQRLMILAITVLPFLLFSTSVSAASLKGKSVLIDGDSLARGSHATVNNGRYSYGDYLASLGADVTNVAVSGARFYYPGGGDLEIINHLSNYAKSKSFDYIVLQGGDNDVDHYNELDNTYNSIETYFQTVKGVSAWQNSKFFFIITPHMDRSSGVLSKANDLWGKVKRLCTKYQIKCINFFKTSENDGNSVPSGFNYNLMSNRISYDQNASVEGSVDGSHPSQKAHNTMGQIIAKKFKTATSDPSDPSNQKTAGNEVKAYTPSVSTYDGTVETSLFGNMQDDGEGCGVYTVLSTVIDVLSIGVGILAAIGIAFMGAKYIASKGDIEQTKKAKRRLYEIIIGLLAYVLLYAGVQWLLPGGHFNANQSCKTLTDTELTEVRQKTQAEKAKKITEMKKTRVATKASTTNEECMKKAAKVVRDKICKLQKQTDRISETAVMLAWPVGTSKSKYINRATPNFISAMKATGTNKGESGCRKSGQACGMFVGTIVRAAGIDPKFPTMASRIYPYVKKSKQWKQVSTSNPKPGDISLSYFSGDSAGHVSIYVKNKKGKTVTAQASLCDFYGVIENRAQYTSSNNKTFRYIGK